MSSSFHIKAISESKLRPLNAKSASSVVGLKLLIEARRTKNNYLWKKRFINQMKMFIPVWCLEQISVIWPGKTELAFV